MDFNELKERKARSKRRWGFIAFLLFFVMPPAAVGLFVAIMLDILPNIGGSVDLTKAVNRTDFNRPVQQMRQPEVWQQPAPVEKSKVHNGMPKNNKLIMGLGLGAMGLFGISGLAAILDGVYTVSDTLQLLAFLSLAAAGGVMAIFGSLRKKKAERFTAYLKLIGDRQAVPIHYLADALGLDYHKVVKDLQEMISRGILDPAWIDMKTYRLMRTDYSEPQPAEKKEETISRSDRILRQIRADNDLIADEEVSSKIDRIEDRTRKIFAIVDERPEKEEQLYTFLNYYLPTTLKALENYARLESQGIETASIKEAKEKINSMLDELAQGYEKQLDRLFENDVVDISADIEVMRQMLKQDGLTEDAIMEATRK